MPRNTSPTSFNRKLTVQSVLAFLLVVFGMIVVMVALYIPPTGEIHPSVITVFGMLLVAAGAFLGIDLNSQIKAFIEALHAAQQQNQIASQSSEDATQDK